MPDIIFALIFVAAVGLGPFSGVLALAVGAIGFMGKLYAEAIESIDPQQVQAVRATGANPLQTFVFGAVPQALPLVAAYSLLLFETNVRSATILGIVGAGGVGFVLSKYMALFQYQRLLGALILIILAVTLIDRASDALRGESSDRVPGPGDGLRASGCRVRRERRDATKRHVPPAAGRPGSRPGGAGRRLRLGGGAGPGPALPAPARRRAPTPAPAGRAS